MRILIIGAGDVGRQMAHILCYRKNDVVVIDTNAEILEELHEQIDVMTINGNGAACRQLIQAGIEKAGMLLALTNNSEANILACTIAKRFNVPLKIARIRSHQYFDDAKGITKKECGIDHAIIPEFLCANDIFDSMLLPAVKEIVNFSHPNARMVNFQIKTDSPMVGTTLVNFPKPEFLNQLRICAILRHGQLIIPSGKTCFFAFDEVYVAGEMGEIDDFIAWASQGQDFLSRVIIAGGTRHGRYLGSLLTTADMNVCFIEPNLRTAEQIADALGNRVLIIQGKSTDINVLQEAGVENCGAFIGTNHDDRENILSCMLAKNHGANRVIAVTNNLDYIKILASIDTIDCCFSPLVSAINTLIKHVESENRQTVAILKRASAEVLEMTVSNRSPVASQRIKDITFNGNMIFALIIRDKELVSATGDREIKVGDRIIVFTETESIRSAEELFADKGFFS